MSTIFQTVADAIRESGREAEDAVESHLVTVDFQAIETLSYCSFPARLTPRHVEILQLVREGKADKEIATLLGISPYTVRSLMTLAFKRLRVSTRAEAVNKCWELGVFTYRSSYRGEHTIACVTAEQCPCRRSRSEDET